MENFRNKEEEFIKKSGVNPKAYKRIEGLLSAVSRKGQDEENKGISFSPLKERINRLIFWRRVRYASFGVMAYTVIFNIFFLKNIMEWTDLAHSLKYFFVFIGYKWLEYMGEFAYRSFSALNAMLTNYWLIIPLILLATVPLIVLRIRRSHQ